MHFLSDHEYAAFLELWWDMDVIDIREQYPLGVMGTLRIAGKLGVKHPVDSHTGVVLPQTTDLLATRGRPDAATLSAWAVKDKSALSDQRTMDKLEIERCYWSEMGVPWQLVVKDVLNSFRALNQRYTDIQLARADGLYGGPLPTSQTVYFGPRGAGTFPGGAVPVAGTETLVSVTLPLFVTVNVYGTV